MSQDRPSEHPAVRTTIVGGRPPGSGTGIGTIPHGLEVLLKKAAVDEAFRGLLLARRAASALSIGLHLAPSEAALLSAVTDAQLAAMVAGTRVPDHQRTAFLSGAAALMLAALGIAGCGDGGAPSPAGVRPDQPPPANNGPNQPGPPVTEGIRPDRPEAGVAQPGPGAISVSRGGRPDRPPQLVPPPQDDVRPTRGIRPDVPPPPEPPVSSGPGR